MQPPEVTVEDLRAFHAKHYPHMALSTEFLYAVGSVQQTSVDDDDDDGLGYYPDGVKRTLTDEQIALFRHTEIHKILHKRRLKKENAEYEPSESDYKPAEKVETMDGVQNGPINTEPAQTLSRKRSIDDETPQSNASTPDTGNSVDSHKLKNRKNKQLWKERKRQRKDNKRRKLEAAGSGRHDAFTDGPYDLDGTGELSPPPNLSDVAGSDEWDPRRQATGPDAQKEVPIDLDY
jgi:hypothetical protein